ncbi:MAG: hypothetical protein GYA52_10315 [Chloroflexi bacterium]|nr:hypothetical protein [Chloroflexota bacterium]
MFIAIGYAIIDDIVLPDGTTHMAVLGGGSIHAAMGMRVWSDRVGLYAGIGNDFPPDLTGKLRDIFDVRGLYMVNAKTVRAWQLFETDGGRTEIFRSDPADFPLYNPQLTAFPQAYKELQGVHLHCGWNEVEKWVKFLRKFSDPFILWEPIQAEFLHENKENFLKILPMVDCISPNLQETKELLQVDDADAMLDEFIDHGAKMAVIRAGADGSIYAGSDGKHIRVPAVPVEAIVDQTGAGNAYCGGLIVGCAQSKDVVAALCQAAVSASFALEQFGALFPMAGLPEKAKDRFDLCMAELQRLN